MNVKKETSTYQKISEEYTDSDSFCLKNTVAKFRYRFIFTMICRNIFIARIPQGF